MGLLDWQPEEDALFPDYTGSVFDELPSNGAAKQTPALRIATDHSRTSSTCSSSTASSALSKTSSSASLNLFLRPASAASHTSSASSASSYGKPHRRRRRAATFDCYGADDELQTAEPRIDYCVICLKHCKVHCKA